MGTSRSVKWINRISVVLMVVSLLTVAGCVLLGLRPFREKGAAPPASSAATSQGSSSETAWNGDFVNFLVCGIDETNSLTDVIMVVGFDRKTGEINVLQIPRDTYAGKDVVSYKYNAVYGHHAKNVGGMENLRAHVEKDFGIRVSYYAAVTTKGFRQLVDAVGGVDLDVPINMNYDDPKQNLHIHLKKGYQHLDGSKAEQFVRYRKGWTQGDIGRLEAQKSFLAALASKLKSVSALTLVGKVVPALMPPNFMTDMTTLQMGRFALAAEKISLSDVSVFTVPGEPVRYRGADLYTVHKDALLPILNEGFVPQGTVLSLSDLGITELDGDGEEAADNNTSNFSDILSGQGASSSK